MQKNCLGNLKKSHPYTNVQNMTAMSDECPTRSGYEKYSYLGGKDKVKKKCFFVQISTNYVFN